MKKRVICKKLISLLSDVCVMALSIVTFLLGGELLLYKGKESWVQFCCIVAGVFVGGCGIGMLFCVMNDLYNTLHFVWPEEMGVRYKFLWKTVKFLRWDEIQEWGVGQQCCKGNKRYNPLPFTEERILREKNKDIGKKYIYFSTHKLTQDERERVFTEAYYKKKEIWLMDYSSKDYLEIFNMKKKKLSEELSEKVSFSCSEQKPQVDMKKKTGYLEVKGGIVLFWLFMLDGGALVGGLMEILEWSLYRAIIVFGIYMLFVVRYACRKIGRVVITEEGIIYRDKFLRKRFWNWSEIYECAVLRNYYYHAGGEYEERYIYFTKKSFIKKNKRETYPCTEEYKKVKDFVMVRYSDKLYWYLKSLGVLGIKE